MSRRGEGKEEGEEGGGRVKSQYKDISMDFFTGVLLYSR